MPERYRGIGFLTTNRLGTIDTAFQSRVSLWNKVWPLAHRTAGTNLAEPGPKTTSRAFGNGGKAGYHDPIGRDEGVEAERTPDSEHPEDGSMCRFHEREKSRGHAFQTYTDDGGSGVEF